MNTVVLSGFNSFGDYKANSSEQVVKRVDRRNLGGFRVYSMVFSASIPESEDRGSTLLYLARSIGASGVISLGMASEKTGFCVETVAANKVSNGKYCSPEQNGKAINPKRPYGEEAPLSLGPWNLSGFRANATRRGISVMPDSRDAGGFCCNHLAYQAAAAQSSSREWRDTPFIFMHIPCSPEAVPDFEAFRSARKVTMSVDDIIAGLDVLLSKSFISSIRL